MIEKQFSKESIVSIVVPIYNAEKYLSRCIESILSQDYYNIELILVDDCSKDSSLDIAKTYQEADKRVRVFRNNRNLGPMRARDNGRIEAKGDWVGFVDADDWLPSDAIKKMILTASNSEADVICGVMEGLSNTGVPLRAFDNTLPYGGASDGVLKALILGKLNHNLAGKLFNKSLFDYKYKIFDNNTNAEDALLFYQIAENVKNMVLIQNVVYFYALGTSATPRGQRMSEKQLTNICLFWTYLLKDFVKKHPEYESHIYDAIFPNIAEKIKQGFSKNKIYSKISIDIDLNDVFNNTYILSNSSGIKKIINYLLFNFDFFGKVCSRLITLKNSL